MRLDRRSGVGSKFNARSGWVSLLGEVLDLCELGATDAASEVCEKSSPDAVSEVFDFCDNLSWDVAAAVGWGLNESYPFRVCRRGLEAIL